MRYDKNAVCGGKDDGLCWVQRWHLIVMWPWVNYLIAGT